MGDGKDGKIQGNKFYNDRAMKFFTECLADLSGQVSLFQSRLNFFYGDNCAVLRDICRVLRVRRVVFNIDYSAYARSRDSAIRKLMIELGNIECFGISDYTIRPLGSLLQPSGDMHTDFKQFYDYALPSLDAVDVDIQFPAKLVKVALVSARD